LQLQLAQTAVYETGTTEGGKLRPFAEDARLLYSPERNFPMAIRRGIPTQMTPPVRA
jgi:hypothetical protein